MEAVMVYAVFFGGFHDREPALGIRGSSSRHGEYHSVVLAPQEYFFAVQKKIRAAGLKLPHAKRYFNGIAAGYYFYCIDNRVMLAPKLRARHFVHKGRVFGGQNNFPGLEALYLGSQGNTVPACYCSAYGDGSRRRVGGKPYIFKAQAAPEFNEYFPGNTKPVRLGVLRGHMPSRNGAGNIVRRDYYFIFTVPHKLRYIVSVSGAEAVSGSRFFTVYPYGRGAGALQRQKDIAVLTSGLLGRDSNRPAVKSVPLEAVWVGKKAVAAFFGNRRLFHLLNCRGKRYRIAEINVRDNGHTLFL